MESTLLIGIMLLFSIIIAKAFGLVKFPAVTGYLIAGMILGPSMFGIIDQNQLSELKSISDIALGLIVFHIGSSFKVANLKSLGRSIPVIAVSQAFVTVSLVFLTLFIFNRNMTFDLLIAPIAAATAPAATLMVVKECGAKGKLTESLFTVLAISDLICILLFSISASAAMNMHDQDTSVWLSLAQPMIEIVFALALGGGVGYGASKLVRKNHSDGFIGIALLGFVILVVGISNQFGISSLLSCLALGGMVINFSGVSERIFHVVDSLSDPILVLFFVIAGMHLDVRILAQVGWPCVIYVLARTTGKIGGSYLGAIVGKADEIISNNLGLCLLSQAGVALGLATSASSIFPALAPQIMNLILGAVLIFEIIGPVITKKVLTKCGESNLCSTIE